MTRVRVEGFTISLDGYGAGPEQDIDHPLGRGGTELPPWLTATRTFQRTHGQDGGSTGVDDDFAARGFENVGSWILGRKLFGPIRGDWTDESWKGWWGDEPPYHCPVYVLTHHGRTPIEMQGDTTFQFVTGGIHEALDRARAAAGGQDVRVGAARTPSGSTCAKPSSTNCTLPSRRCCLAAASRCSRGWTCARWATNAWTP